MQYSVLAYYVLKPVIDPEREVKSHKDFLKSLDSKGRIYISEEGINAQLSLADRDVLTYLSYLEEHPIFREAEVKVQNWHEHAFAKLTVKYRKQLVALDQKVDFEKRGEYLTPKEWSSMLDKRGEDTLLIDVRNQYESKIGYFEGALVPDLETFREFPEYAKQLAESHDPGKTKVMMYCTGGIRCEYYSALMKKIGFQNVFHLKGGVIQYGQEEGSKHWRGKLFVFDDRLTVPISQDNTETIGKCQFCEALSDTYYNCANMDCNTLFNSCSSCIQAKQGCCQDTCLQGRVRAFTLAKHPKPFRKLRKEEKGSYTNPSK